MKKRTAAISIIIMLLIIVIIVSDRGLKDHKSAHTNGISTRQNVVKQTDDITEDIVTTDSTQDMPTAKTETESQQEDTSVNGKLKISMDFVHSNTQASNQYAVWIENMDGDVVKTLFVTNFTSNGGYTMREDSIPTWVSHAKPSEMTKTQIDAITGATPSNGTYSYIWDGTDNNGNEVANGTYTFHIEGTLYWSSIVHYQGNVDMGASENSLLDVEAVYTEETNQNKNMLSNVTAEYIIEE